ncbi:MAG: DNA repair protein RecN [Clostridia bacterium]|nr:DNA repair protein RecN [Clostridia bacterium]
MILSLNIKNVALISQADIEFTSGLNILSGETGSGKSVILDSINFVLGAKADKNMIRHGEDSCIVTCVFRDYPTKINDFLAEYDIEAGEEIIIKRKFDINGNGYIKLNGENVTATMLRKITSTLVDVHGQSEHFSLLSKQNQLDCIDYGAQTQSYLDELKLSLTTLNSFKKQLESLGGNAETRKQKIELLEYQINEIDKACLKEGEYEQLLERKNKLLNLEKLTTALSSAHSALNDENGAIDCLYSAEHSLKPIQEIDNEYAKLCERLNNLGEEINDISEEISSILYDLDIDDNIDDIEQRLDVYNSFFRKYGKSITEINEFYEKANTELNQLLNFDKTYADLLLNIQKCHKQTYEICLKLSNKRKNYATDFCSAVVNKLSELGMPKAQFIVDFGEFPSYSTEIAFNSYGLDKVEFLFSANAGEPVKPLSKIISGGEMSRFMLALKTQLTSGLGTYIFDEIDAGISGVTATTVAKQFAQISKERQVIAISHLPQIAAMSDRSLLIYKFENDGKTYTDVKLLSSDQKAQEITRLIGGSSIDEVAMKHATNMINESIEYKNSLK